MTGIIVPATVSLVAPELAAQIEDAPGQGILPGVSLHLAAEPTNSTFVKWTTS